MDEILKFPLHSTKSTKTYFIVSREQLGAAHFHPKLFRHDKLYLEGPVSLQQLQKVSKPPGSGVGIYMADSCI